MPDAPPSTPPTRTVWLSVACIVAAAGLVRLPALLSDFWFDEILSYERYARAAQSALDVFLAPALKHDNNHHLNTLALYWLGDQRHWVVYRLPAALAGLAAVAGAVLIGCRRSRLEGLVSGALVGGSFMLAVHSSEARGYAAVLCAASCGFLALDRFLSSGSRGAMLAFWASFALGIAAHPTMLHFYLGALLWSGFHLRARLRDLARLHAGPAIWMMAWILAVVRGSVVGGGPAWTWDQIIDRSLGWTFGFPLATVPVVAAALALVTLVVWDARRLWTEGSDEGLFSVGAILGPPTFLAAVSPPYLFPRYFLISMFFALLISGRSLARLWQRGARGRLAMMALLALFAWGNGLHLATFAAERTGHYAAAVTLVADSRAGGPVVVTSPSLDQWSELPIRFYERVLGLGDRIRYVPRADVVARSPDVPRIDWVIEPEEPCDPHPGDRLTLRNGETFVLRRAHRICGPSGMSWFLYTRE